MTSTPQFSRLDTTRPDGCFIQFARIIEPDMSATRPDEISDGFWPSSDTQAPGYVPPERFAEELDKAHARMRGFELGAWEYIGVRARALCLVVRDRVGTLINIDSPGVWGVESDSGEEHIKGIYEDEISQLQDILAAFGNVTFEA